jgi:pimeloyl-[acyl-carrier protein] methyl ester esterase
MNKQKHFYLIKGLIREAEHWGDFPKILKEQFPEAKISFIDIPGAGEFVTHKTPLSVPKITKFMRQKFLLLKNDNEESIILAISLGAMIATCWMKNFKHDFQKAVLINTSFGDYSPFYHRLKPKALFYLSKVPLLTGRSKEERIIKLVSNNSLHFDKTIQLWEKIAKERPVSLENTMRQLLAASVFRVGKFKPHIPVLLLGSTNDRMVSIKCSREIAEKWSVPLHEHPEGGHHLTSDDPLWVSQQIKNWIKS